jgi:hypothetical protein
VYRELLEVTEAAADSESLFRTKSMSEIWMLRQPSLRRAANSKGFFDLPLASRLIYGDQAGERSRGAPTIKSGENLQREVQLRSDPTLE